jgi:hypothetical protein
MNFAELITSEQIDQPLSTNSDFSGHIHQRSLKVVYQCNPIFLWLIRRPQLYLGFQAILVNTEASHALFTQYTTILTAGSCPCLAVKG